jgi:serine beta-lactamase-like protein LACTB, mitochondrial
MADTTVRVHRALLDMHTKQRNVGLSAAVLKDGRLVLSECLGFADLEHQVSVKRQTRFMIASVTKAFTGAALIKLNEAKIIDLDVPIQQYVPTFPQKDRANITARLLAAHLGGIRHYSTGEKSPQFFSNHYDDALAAIELFQADPLIAPPGTRYSYSSYGYNLLAAVVQSASGQPFPTYVQKAIVEPLGLDNTLFDDVRRVVRNRARLYSYYDPLTYEEGSELWRVPDWDYSYNMGGGNILSTAEDLVSFGAAFMEPGFFTRNSLRFLHSAQRTAYAESPWSYGWFVKRDEAGRRYLSITGAVPGSQAGLIIYPEHKLATAILINSWWTGASSGEMVSDLPLGISKVYLEK